MMILLNLLIFFCGLTLSYSRCPDVSWISWSDRCYKNFGSSIFENVTEMCETEEAHVISILSDAENQFFKNIGTSKGKNKWLGITPSRKHPKEFFPDSILWMDYNFGNYSNFDHSRTCPGDECCVYQKVDSFWEFTDCDYEFEVWCYITVDESHTRLVAGLDDHIRNATILMEMYPTELLKFDNIKRLSVILREIRDALHLSGKKPLSANLILPVIALVFSMVTVIAVIFLFMIFKKRERAVNPDYNGIARGSFNYSQRESYPTKSEMTEVNFGNEYGKHEKEMRNSSLARSCSRFIDSPMQFESTNVLDDFVTSEPQEV